MKGKIREFLESVDWGEVAMDALLVGAGFALGYAVKQPEAKDVAHIDMKGDPELLKKAIDAWMDDTE